MPDNFLNSARVAELWAAIKTALAGKADLSALDGYTTPDQLRHQRGRPDGHCNRPCQLHDRH